MARMEFRFTKVYGKKTKSCKYILQIHDFQTKPFGPPSTMLKLGPTTHLAEFCTAAPGSSLVLCD